MKEGKMSKEQMCKILHISKRKAKWMLENGIIPCEKRNTATHSFTVDISDVEAYLALGNGKIKIPVGLFNAREPSTELHPELCLKLRGRKRARFKDFLLERLAGFPDSMTVDEAAVAIGYHRQTVLRHTVKHDICAVRLHGKFYIAKESLIAFLATDKAFRIQRKSRWHIEAVRDFIIAEELR